MNFFLKLKKYTKGLIFINVFLLLLLIFISIPKQEKDVFNAPLVLKNNIENIDEIIFTIPDNSLPPVFNELILFKKKDKFFLKTMAGEYQVKTPLVDRLFSILSTKQNFRFVDDNVKQYINFGLDDDHSARLKLLRSDKTIIGEFIFGKKDTLGINRYVRIDARTKVFIMPDVLSSFLTVNNNFWLDLQIYKYKLQNNSIRRIEKNNKFSIRSNKTEKEFNELETFLRQFSCIDIFPAFPVITSESEEFSLILENGERIKIELTPMEGGDFILLDSSSKKPYVISGYTKRRIDSIINSIF
ncbi:MULTISPECIES: DUF4340 domain-containing protein [unclassified Treponema]|uniref:DUF4340 domain-containing protein n=1 Tax=unclassified Treponema TaxID=2638727 RepID=UPI0020A38FD2|nr:MULTISPECIES: DUF4340 domain-containing protein [unclassified Treponema]UTC67668.1 DUF4340 domain-containing protein [Treponema sp. OMZ 789]UTC70396.1 DUF4340 domain-containing protein [Treponema sp. OMZ 790]UTC73110.1 DUF4340 domain-containing protein [Treponema sp. OMZ 791]